MNLRLGTQLRALLSLTLACSLWACAAQNAPSRAPTRDPWEGRGRECVRPFLGRGSPYSELPSVASDESLLSEVPAEAYRTMLAAGLSPMVARALADSRQHAPMSVEMLATRQDLGMRLISLETQLAAVIFEAECTGELIEAMAFELEDRGDLRELRLAIASLVVGALAATSAGVWDLAQGDSPGPAVLGLAGGVGSASIGAAAFVKRSEHMRFVHDHNLLAPVLEGSDEGELFPAFVFRLLTLPGPKGAASPRERLLARWGELIDEVVAPSQRAATSALLYGRGGIYDSQLVALRERMYDALESELNAQARDLELLDRFLVRALARP